MRRPLVASDFGPREWSTLAGPAGCPSAHRLSLPRRLAGYAGSNTGGRRRCGRDWHRAAARRRTPAWTTLPTVPGPRAQPSPSATATDDTLAHVSDDSLTRHHRLRYSVRGPEWAFLVPSGNLDALEDTMRRCSAFWNGAGSLIVPVDARGRIPAFIDNFLEARAVDEAWAHPSLPSPWLGALAGRFPSLSTLHDDFDRHETHPLRLLPPDGELPSIVVPHEHSATMRRLRLALWGDIAKDDLEHYERRCEVRAAARGAESWQALVDGQVDGQHTSPLRMVQRGMGLVWADSTAEYPYIWAFPARPTFGDLVSFWNIRARLLARAAGTPVLGVPQQALAMPERLSALGDWLPRQQGYRSTPDCFVSATKRLLPPVRRALVAAGLDEETAKKYGHTSGSAIEPAPRPTFAFRAPQLWARFQRGVADTALVSIVDGEAALALPAPERFAARDMSYVRLTLHDLPLAMPLTASAARRVNVNAVAGDGVRIKTPASAAWNFDIRLPSAAEALGDWAADKGFAFMTTRDGLDAQAILRRVGSTSRLDVLADRRRLSILKALAPASTRKLAQGLSEELAGRGEAVDVDGLAERLADHALFLELRARTASDIAVALGAGTNKKGVLAALPPLVELGFIRRAREVTCPECRFRTLLDLAQQDETVRCAACRASFTMPIVDGSGEKEPDVMYRLDGLMARAMDQDVLPVLLALRAFVPSAHDARPFSAWPGLEFTAHEQRNGTDVDLLVSYGDTVFCCEVKTSASGLGSRQLDGLLQVCDRLNARPAVAALHGTFSAHTVKAITSRRGRILDADVLLADSPDLNILTGRYGVFAG